MKKEIKKQFKRSMKLRVGSLKRQTKLTNFQQTHQEKKRAQINKIR